MSLIFLPKSSAYSWKMSFYGQVLWNRMLIGPCALTTAGALTAAAVATAAPLRTNRRRVASLDVRDRSVLSVLMGVALLGFPSVPRGILGPLGYMNRPDRFPIPVNPVVGRDVASYKVPIVSVAREMPRFVGKNLHKVGA
jgi:hypothetical protein